MELSTYGRVRAASFNQQMACDAKIMADTITELDRLGFTVIGIEARPNMVRPTIYVQDDVVCRDMIGTGEAVYYYQGHTGVMGHHRAGQFNFAGCRVVWLELNARTH